MLSVGFPWLGEALPVLSFGHIIGLTEKASLALPVHPQAGIAAHYWPFMRPSPTSVARISFRSVMMDVAWAWL